MQTRLDSFKEVVYTTIVGVLTGWLVWQYVIVPYADMFMWDFRHLTLFQIFITQMIFRARGMTVQYIIRRWFNRKEK